MSLRSSFCRILRFRNPSCPPPGTIIEKSQASDAAEAAFHTSLMSRGYGTRAAADGLWFMGRSRTCGCGLIHASSMPPLRQMAFSSYRHSAYPRIRINKFKGLNSRNYSGGTGLFTPGGVLWTLIGTNVAVYAMWQHINYRFMEKHFMVSIDSVVSGRLHTVLTSAFSQKDTTHLLSNMIGLYFFGSEIGRIFGGKYLLTLYFAGAVGGSLGHMFYYAYLYPWLQNIPSYFYNTRYSPGALGASGAVTTVMLLHIFLYPKHTILFQMFIPMPAALMGAIIIGRDLWLAKQGDTDVSVGGHLGGAVVAFLAFLQIRRPWF